MYKWDVLELLVFLMDVSETKRLSIFAASVQEYQTLTQRFSKEQHAAMEPVVCKLCTPGFQVTWNGMLISIWRPYEGHELIESISFSANAEPTCKSFSTVFGHDCSRCELDLFVSDQEFLVLDGIPPQLIRLTEFL